MPVIPNYCAVCKKRLRDELWLKQEPAPDVLLSKCLSCLRKSLEYKEAAVRLRARKKSGC